MIDISTSLERALSLSTRLVELPPEEAELAQNMKDLGWTVRTMKPADQPAKVESSVTNGEDSGTPTTESLENPIQAALRHLPHPKIFGF